MSWNHIRDERPIAAKNHRCHLCGLPIPKGERHVYRVGTWEGEMSPFRMHEACEAISKSWTEEDWECHDAAEFREHLRGAGDPK